MILSGMAHVFTRRVRGFRVIDLMALILLLALALGVYAFKTLAGRESADIDDVQRQIVVEQKRVRMLRDVPNIVAVKDSTGDFRGISRLMAEAPDFEVYSGDDWATFGYVCLGAVGVVSVVSHIAGERIRHMIEFLEGGDLDGARKIHYELLPAFRSLFVTTNPIPLKAAMSLLGRPVGPPRLPLVPATDDEVARIRSGMEAAGVL